MSNYIQLVHSLNKLPLIEQEWLFVEPTNILATTPFKKVIYDSLSTVEKVKIDFHSITKETGSYPRFNIEDSVYPIVKANYNLLPNGEYITDFNNISDRRSTELLDASINYDTVYLFYSGGIDSTLILTSIIKNWSPADLKKVVIVMNSHSIIENPLMYEMYIKDKFVTVDSSLFFSQETKLSNNHLYVTGDLGGQLADYENLGLYDAMFPDTYIQNWKTNKDNIICYFGNNEPAKIAYQMIEDSIIQHNVNAITVFDFLWWISFNWGYDIGMYFLPTLYGTISEQTCMKQFMENNYFIWYNSMPYQNWAMSTAGTGSKMGDSILQSKLPMKRFIFDFNKDLDYFQYKRHERSISKSKHKFKRVPMGVDVNYNIYYRNSLAYK